MRFVAQLMLLGLKLLHPPCSVGGAKGAIKNRSDDAPPEPAFLNSPSLYEEGLTLQPTFVPASDSTALNRVSGV